MTEEINKSVKGGEIIYTDISSITTIHVRITKAFLEGRFGKGNFSLYRNLDNANMVIYIHCADSAMISVLSGDIVQEINQLL